MTSLLLLVAGAALGVLLDRVVQLAEGAYRVQIQRSWNYGKGGSTTGFKLTNTGRTQLPPHQLVLYHPRRHGLAFDLKAGAVSPLPMQQANHQLPFHRTREMDDWILHVGPSSRRGPAPLDEEDMAGFEVRVMLADSELPLFRFNRAGRSIIEEQIAERKLPAPRTYRQVTNHGDYYAGDVFALPTILARGMLTFDQFMRTHAPRYARRGTR